jgi:hypothetical protein
VCVCLIERIDDENKQELTTEKYQSKMAFYFVVVVVAGEEMWKFNCWRVSLQLSNFIYLVFFLNFRLVSQGRPLGNISIDIIFFSSGLKHAFD